MRTRPLTTLLAIFLTALGSAFLLPLGDAAASDAAPKSPAQRAFARFQALEGTWTGTGRDGQPVEMTFRLTGDGSTVMEHFRMDGDHDMFTAYHLDGESIFLTHYCAAGNQPRMRATELPEDGPIRFELVDVTGLASPGDGHMHRATFDLGDPARLSTAWTWHENGEDVFTETIEATRASGR